MNISVSFRIKSYRKFFHFHVGKSWDLEFMIKVPWESGSWVCTCSLHILLVNKVITSSKFCIVDGSEYINRQRNTYRSRTLKLSGTKKALQINIFINSLSFFSKSKYYSSFIYSTSSFKPFNTLISLKKGLIYMGHIAPLSPKNTEVWAKKILFSSTWFREKVIHVLSIFIN